MCASYLCKLHFWVDEREVVERNRISVIWKQKALSIKWYIIHPTFRNVLGILTFNGCVQKCFPIVGAFLKESNYYQFALRLASVNTYYTIHTQPTSKGTTHIIAWDLRSWSDTVPCLTQPPLTITTKKSIWREFLTYAAQNMAQRGKTNHVSKSKVMKIDTFHPEIVNIANPLNRLSMQPVKG